jgi:hypothetical protein
MTPIEAIGLYIGLGILILVCYYFLAKWQERMDNEKNEYEMKYKFIQYHIDSDVKTAENYSNIERMLTCLGKLPYRNKEKTIKLSENFWDKWTDERLKRL